MALMQGSGATLLDAGSDPDGTSSREICVGFPASAESWTLGLRPSKHPSTKLDQGGLPADQPTAPPLCGSVYATASNECKTVVK